MAEKREVLLGIFTPQCHLSQHGAPAHPDLDAEVLAILSQLSFPGLVLFPLWAELEGSGRLLLLRGGGALFLHPYDQGPGSGQQLPGAGGMFSV